MVHHIEENRIPEEIVRNSERLMIIDFYADWCIPCQMLSPIMTELDKKYKGVEFYRVNIEESPNYVTTNNIKSIPTIIFYKDGKETERIVGLESMEKISNIIDYYQIKDN